MKTRTKALLLTSAVSLSMLGSACSAPASTAASTDAQTQAQTQETVQDASAQVSANETEVVAEGQQTPKYVFLFIGDGMSYPQIQLTNYFVSANNQDGAQTVNVDGEDQTVLSSQNNLTMMQFPVAGSAQTYDSTSFAPDSASTATSIATGYKTWSGSINVSTDFSQEYETIAEKLKAQKDYKIGVVTSVNLNHATPAAFYAHQASRNSYYEIGLELIESNFDYFAGGGLLSPTGSEEDQTDLYQLAEEAGYTVVRTQAEAEALTADTGKTIVIEEHLADSDSMPYAMDLEEGQWGLADYVEKGIEMLDNDNGFFMMVEGGKIDWACHANDAAATISDTIAFDNAVAKAVEFYEEHPDETLILVTGDHETGGLTIGYAGTDYDTFLTNFNNQKLSFAKFDSDYVSGYKENKTDFETVMQDVTELFGLAAPAEEGASTTQQKDSADMHPESNNDGTLEMTQYEYDLLREAYDTTMSRTGEEEEFAQDEYIKYGSYEPLTVTITHILNNKSGINFGSYAHTGLPVEVFAQGVGQDNFSGYYDNTDIYNKLAALTGVE
ncbi:alkaline phosphatase [Catenibacillus scindens]|uniref:Alkaline phosphatase n=1 Tax=Catenibacillus scindens TaxID=673271 RepID=A0A7W8HE44_9FIRM|nr:alkaline phosphatase [Catenibacillus scindens]MBB5266007.1 alkaline phosphatase [Catenibacillus scindens]